MAVVIVHGVCGLLWLHEWALGGHVTTFEFITIHLNSLLYMHTSVTIPKTFSVGVWRKRFYLQHFEGALSLFTV